MLVTVNDAEHEVTHGITLDQLLQRLGRANQGIALAVNGEVVRKGQWSDFVVPEGAKLEILSAVQGG